MPSPRSDGVVVRDAATVVLVRDLPDLHVLMLRRNPASVFVGGAHVFPGGAVDPADADPALAARCVGAATDPPGDPRFWVAAVREVFEEVGLLLAHPRGGATVRHAATVGAARAALNAGDASAFGRLLHDLDLVIDLDALAVFSHWITPRGAPRRYDTWFFVAAAPPGQEPDHDDVEAVGCEWIRPRDALARGAAGDVELIYPTRRTLEALAHHPHAASALAAARSPHARDWEQAVPRLAAGGGAG